MMELDAFDPLDAIHVALEAHGIPSARGANDVHLTHGDLRFEAGVFDRADGKQRDAFHLVVLEIHIFSSRLSICPIIECFAGWGGTHREAVSEAFGKFLQGVFHVVIEALTDYASEHMQTDVEHWSCHRAAWNVHLGPAATQYKSEPTLLHTYDGFVDRLKDVLMASLPPTDHCLRFFAATFDAELGSVEVLLNNEPWPCAETLLRDHLKQTWHGGIGYQSIRQFLVAQSERVH